MASGPLAANKAAFDTFRHEVYEARWGSVFGALASLLPLERLLRAAWDVEAFRGRSGDEEKKEGKSMDLATVDLGIQSDFVWAYAHMLDAIGELLSEVTTWGARIDHHDIHRQTHSGGRVCTNCANGISHGSTRSAKYARCSSARHGHKQ